MSRAILSPPPDELGPAWDIARLFPNQGDWGEGDYLELNRLTNRLVELADGYVEVLEMPTKTHQRIVLFLCNALLAFAKDQRLGEAIVAAYPVRLRPGKFRQPDIVFMLTEHADRLGEDFAEGADLVVEVVSEDRRRDLEIKVAEYAAAGIPEYWIVDPRAQTISVLHLAGSEYATDGPLRPGQEATSRLMPGFKVSIAAVFDAARGTR
jgi:Uma2 family endonuclease